MAAKVATVATMVIGMMDMNVNGTAMKSKNPVALFAMV